MSDLQTGFDVILIPMFAEILMDDTSERIKDIRFSALRQLLGQLNFYKKRGYCSKLLCGIAEKKGEMIRKITSKAEQEKVLKPHIPHYNGAEFIPDEYYIPEEELICWSETSFQGSLIDVAYKRYMQVFKEVFPEESKKIFKS